MDNDNTERVDSIPVSPGETHDIWLQYLTGKKKPNAKKVLKQAKGGRSGSLDPDTRTAVEGALAADGKRLGRVLELLIAAEGEGNHPVVMDLASAALVGCGLITREAENARQRFLGSFAVWIESLPRRRRSKKELTLLLTALRVALFREFVTAEDLADHFSDFFATESKATAKEPKRAQTTPGGLLLTSAPDPAAVRTMVSIHRGAVERTYTLEARAREATDASENWIAVAAKAFGSAMKA